MCRASRGTIILWFSTCILNADQLIWAVKDGKYLDALSTVLTLGNLANGQDWIKIIDNLQNKNYAVALSTAFKLVKSDDPNIQKVLQDGESVADAVNAISKKDYVTAFFNSFNLIEGGKDLVNVFKYLINFDLGKFITSTVKAVPLLAKFFF